MTRGYPDWFTPHRDSDYPFPAKEENEFLSSGAVSGTGQLSLMSKVLDSDWDCFLRRLVVYGIAGSEPFLARGEGFELWVQIGSNDLARLTFTDSNLAVVGSGSEWRVGAYIPLHDARVSAGETVAIMLRVFNLVSFSDIVVILSYIKELSTL